MLLADIADYGKVNEIYASCKFNETLITIHSLQLIICKLDFTKIKPARSAFAVAGLPKVYHYEILLIYRPTP